MSATRESQIRLGNRPVVATRTAHGRLSPLNPYLVSGLTVGEGCFCVSFARRDTLVTGVQIGPSFALGLHERDRDLINALRAFFGCGSVRDDKGDGNVKFESRALPDLLERIIPHFERYPLCGAKADSFATFVEVCDMIARGDHLRPNGARRIIDIAFDMNPAGKRRLSRAQLLNALRK